VLLITGPVGVGKSTVADEVSLLLEQSGRSHSNIDVDSLRQVFPRPSGDQFARNLGLSALQALWALHRDAGAESLILSTMVTSEAMVEEYRAVLPGADITVVRLAASDDVIQARLHHREQGSDLRWNLSRSAELQSFFESASLRSILVDTSALSAAEAAQAVLRAADW
jgi:adenylylsulfate kinase-like enzyme